MRKILLIQFDDGTEKYNGGLFVATEELLTYYGGTFKSLIYRGTLEGSIEKEEVVVLKEVEISDN